VQQKHKPTQLAIDRIQRDNRRVLPHSRRLAQATANCRHLGWQLDRDDNLRVEANGKAPFNQITEFCHRARADQLSALVLSLVRAQYPDDLHD
jgi:hypothetical protein